MGKMRKERSVFAERHPLVSLVYLAGALSITMLTMHPLILGLSFLLSGGYVLLLQGKKAGRYTLWMLLPLLFFSSVILPLFSHNGVTPLFYINDMAVTLESVLYGAVMSLLLVSVFQWFQVWRQLLDEERFLYLFGRGLPAAALLLSMALRLLPLLHRRYREIHDAQRGMGRDGGAMTFWKRGKLLLKELSILISWSLENSITTSMSMESRGYGSGKRTSFHLFVFGWEDGAWLVLLLLLFGGCILIIGQGGFAARYFPAVSEMPWGRSQTAGLCCFGAGAGLPLLWDLLHLEGDNCQSWGKETEE